MVVIFVAFFVITFCIIIKYKRRFELGYKIPGPMAIPFIGSITMANLTTENIYGKMNELQKVYPDCFKLWLGLHLWVYFHNSEHIEKLVNNPDIAKPEPFQMLRPLIGNGLLISKGRTWFSTRRALTPAFHFKILDGFIESFSRQSDVMAEKFKTMSGPIEVTPHLLLYVLDIICETAMGARQNFQTDQNCDYVEAFNDASHILFKQMANPLLHIEWIFNKTQDYKTLTKAIQTIHNLAENVIREKREQHKNQPDISVEDEFGRKKKLALLDVLLKTTRDGVPLTDEEIKDEVNTFLFAGVDTTKSAVSFLLYNLAKYKDIQEKVIEEIHSVFGDDPTREIDIESLKKLKYFHQVIKESLRFHPTVPVTGREIKEEIQVGEYIIPKDTVLWINMSGMMHDSRVFENPEKFDPDRFGPDRDEKLSPYAYMPFSAGPHNCIGRRYALLIVKTLATKLLLHFEISLANPDEKLKLISEMVLKSKTGINLVFKNRENSYL